jgi:predicted regulator of Ras-like GTPase activity (Roadblock/LC7/MglB family)
MTFPGDTSMHSAFGRILRRMVESTPGVHGAVLADWEGEPVDQYSRGPVLEIQITGAQWGLVLAEVGQALARARAGAARWLYLCCERAQVLVRPLDHEYFVVMQASPDAHVGKLVAGLEQAARELLHEMC